MKVLAAIVILVTLAAVAWHGFDAGHEVAPPVIADPVTRPTPAVPAEDAFGEWLDEPESLIDELQREAAGAGSAKRLVPVPETTSERDNDSRYTDLDAIEEHELEDFTGVNLERGIAGDLASANRAIHAQRRCAHVPRSYAELEAQLERQDRRFRQREPRDAYDRSDLRERFVARFEACQAQAQLFDDSLMARLDSLAQQGSVTARYLYSLLPPDTFGRVDAFLRHQEWADKALSYSLANLTQGETAGLLAFGQSYANQGLFTASDRYLGTSFIIAAIQCGLELDYYRRYVESFLNSDRFAEPRVEVLVMADGLRSFCS